MKGSVQLGILVEFPFTVWTIPKQSAAINNIELG